MSQTDETTEPNDEGASPTDTESEVTTDATDADSGTVESGGAADETDDTTSSGDVVSADDDVIDEDELLEAPVRPQSAYDRPGRWYVLHSQSGYENKVRQNLEARTRSMNMEERIYEIEIPLEDVAEIRNGKKVVVIGSGATAVTLLPALVDSGVGHVTMLQRSPTYIGVLPGVSPVAPKANKYLPSKAANTVNRWYAIGVSSMQYRLARRFPKNFRKALLTMAKRQLPAGYDVEGNFGPDYNPWDQRVCLAPDGDLFRSIRSGKADVVTDRIDHITETGIQLASGKHLDADIIVTATGLTLQLFGGATISRNGEVVDPGQRLAYRALMLEGMPNAAFTFGYVNASWTLKADLVSQYVCRLLNYMDQNGYTTVEPVTPSGDVQRLPFTDMSSGYFARAQHILPQRGSKGPWQIKHDYFRDINSLRRTPIATPELRFGRQRAAVSASSATG